MKSRALFRNAKPLTRFALSCLLALLAATTAWASEGVFLLGNDALQLGRASSGVASPRSAYWSYMNPASIVDLERRFDTNLYTVFTDIDFEPKGIIGNRFESPLESNGIFEILSTGLIWPLKHGTLGGGLYVPSGTGVEYDHSRNLLSRFFSDNSDRQLDYQHFRLVLSYGYKFENGWALGGSLHGSVSRFSTDHITLGLHKAFADTGWDQGLGAGFGLGLYKKWDKWAVGVAYSSRHWTESMDRYSDLLKNSLDTPRIVQAGIAYAITPNLELTADFKYLNWKDVKSYGANLYFTGGFCWDDQYGVKLGLEWKLNDQWTLMTGFSHTNSPVSNDHVFLAGLVPVVVEDHLTAGFTYKFNKAHEIHVVACHAFEKTMTESGKGLGNGDIFSVLGKGSVLSSSAESLCLGYSYKF